MKRVISLVLMICLFSLNLLPAFADCACSQEQVLCTESLCINKKAPNHSITITNYRKIICSGNVLAIEFECPFYSKKACAGDVVNFVLPESLYTEEGTLLLPACTKVVAEIIKMQHPKWFNKNARVKMAFRCLVLPNGKVIPIDAKAFTKDGTLKEGPWMTTGKIFLSTITLGIIGGGAGVGFGFLATPAKVGIGIGSGIAIGCGVGLLSALITKGLHYKAKSCEKIYIILCNDASICN